MPDTWTNSVIREERNGDKTIQYIQRGILGKWFAWMMNTAVLALIALNVWEVEQIQQLRIFKSAGDRYTLQQGYALDRRITMLEVRTPENIKALGERLLRMETTMDSRLIRMNDKIDKILREVRDE